MFNELDKIQRVQPTLLTVSEEELQAMKMELEDEIAKLGLT